MIANEIETTNEEWVIGPGGVKMTKKEYREWLESERN
jgi:hypothetical protein